MEQKKSLLTIGGSGMVGSRVTELLTDRYTIIDESRETGFDITDMRSVLDKLRSSDAEWVVLYAAKADVEGCEKDRVRDAEFLSGTLSENVILEEKTAWALNVLGARNVVNGCKETGKKLVYISTDFVFGGDDTPEAGYTEESKPHPINWYGQTKYEAEQLVSGLPGVWAIVRLAYPYRAAFDMKKDFVRTFVSLLEAGKQLNLVTDHINNPTFIDDIASAMDAIFTSGEKGIYHVTGSSALSPYDEGLLVAKVFGLDETFLGKTTRKEFFKGRASRPFNLKMNNDKIEKMGVTMTGFEEGLEMVKMQMAKIR